MKSFRQDLAIYSRRGVTSRGPHRVGEAGVRFEAGDHVEMQVRSRSAQRSDVHLDRLQQSNQHTLNCRNDVHEVVTVNTAEIAQLANMLVPDYPTPAVKPRLIRQDDPTSRIRPKRGFRNRMTIPANQLYSPIKIIRMMY